jgi:fimbrial chaperone protein
MAGSFTVSPVKLHFNFKTKTTVIRITNNNDEKVTVQLDAKEWSQDEPGPDIYQQTKDIVFFPKIITIEKKEERIIRVGYQGNESAATEKTYRLFLDELPVTKPGEMALRFALRVAVPIFISPLKEIKKPSIEKVKLLEGKLAVKVKNSGNIHFIVGEITAIGLDSLGKEVFKKDVNGWYVLAGVARTFDIDIPEEDCIKADKIKVTVGVERTSMRDDLFLDQSQCVNKKENGKALGGQRSK